MGQVHIRASACVRVCVRACVPARMRVCAHAKKQHTSVNNSAHLVLQALGLLTADTWHH